MTHIVELSFRTFAYKSTKEEWFTSWTIMYWAWWISWAPFVGLFIAKISRGRTIREFMALPFSLIMVVMAFCPLRGLWVDDSYFSRNLSKSTAYWDGKHWQARLKKSSPRKTRGCARLPARCRRSCL